MLQTLRGCLKQMTGAHRRRKTIIWHRTLSVQLVLDHLSTGLVEQIKRTSVEVRTFSATKRKLVLVSFAYYPRQ